MNTPVKCAKYAALDNKTKYLDVNVRVPAQILFMFT